MSKPAAWIKAFRLRTLPLTVCCVALGSSLAYYYHGFQLNLALLALSTAILLQILSNLANDYGDFVKGTDNEQRVGPQRALQSGIISQKEMLLALVLFSILSLLSGIFLIFSASGNINLNEAFVFLILGILSILAAITYTVGKKAYGYSGLGDLMVFLFFGPIGVFGTFYLQNPTLAYEIMLPACSFGLFSTGVLNMNNTRDIENDRECGKITIPVRIGFNAARVYQLFLITLALASTWIFLISFTQIQKTWIYGFSLPLFFIINRRMFRSSEYSEFDLFLKLTVLGTIIWTIVTCILLLS